MLEFGGRLREPISVVSKALSLKVTELRVTGRSETKIDPKLVLLTFLGSKTVIFRNELACSPRKSKY